MKQLKSKWVIIVILALIMISILTLIMDRNIRFVVRETFFPTSFLSYKRASVEDFISYKEDFFTIKNVCLNYYDSMKDTKRNYFMVNYDGSKEYMFHVYKKQKVSLSKHEQRSLNRVNESFGYDYLNMIYFDENRITFRGEDDFAIVYSFDNKKPKFLKKGEDPRDYYYHVRKLDDHWYAITSTRIRWDE